MSHVDCNALVAYMGTKTDSTLNSTDMPWHDGNSINWNRIEDMNIKAIITAYKYRLCQIVSRYHGELVYPTFTDMVLWVPGKSMPPHTDDGDGFEDMKNLHTRKYTAILYLNDDFEGGETFVLDASAGKRFFKPVKGAALVLTSDKRCIHGVNILTSGLRYTLPVWMTVNPADCEV